MLREGAAIDVFVSYSHRDEELREDLEAHLTTLKRQGLVNTWNDRDISAGTSWREEIDRNLTSAHVVLLLVSPAFLSSKYCWDQEMTRALERHRAGEARVIPIILRPCDWHPSPIGALQALPRDGKPVTKWADRDDAFLDVVRGIRVVIEELHKASAKPPEKAFLYFLRGLEPEHGDEDRQQVEQALRLGLEQLGIGGKRSGGFGVFGEEPEAAKLVPAQALEPTPPERKAPPPPKLPKGERLWKGATLCLGADGVEAFQGSKRAVDLNGVVEAAVARRLGNNEAKADVTVAEGLGVWRIVRVENVQG